MLPMDQGLDNSPLVSVIMASYNRASFVGEAVESIGAQTYDNWELIAVDDGSSDDTLDILEGYAAQDSRIRVYSNARNLGGARTHNVAISHARGDLIAIQDSDDVSLPDRLETSVRAFERYADLGAFTGLYITIDPQGNDIGYRFSYTVPHSSNMFRASLLRQVGCYDADFRYGFEVDLYLRLRAAGARFGRVDRPLVKVRVHPGQTSSSNAFERAAFRKAAEQRALARERGEEFDLDAALDRLRRDPGLLAHTAYGLGWRRLQHGDPQTAREHFQEALRHRPSYATARLWRSLTALPPSVVRAMARAWLGAKGALPWIGSPLDDWWEVLDV